MEKIRISVGKVPITAGVCCPHEAPRGVSWSLAPLRKSLRNTDRFLLAGLYQPFADLSVRYAYAPHVAPSSARITDACEFEQRIQLSGDIFLHVGKMEPADGVILGKGHAFAMSGLGCPVIIGASRNPEAPIVVAHAGRDSLIDRGAVMGEPTRLYPSVVGAVAKALFEMGAEPAEIRLHMLFSIPVQAFEHPIDHPVHGEFNKKLFEFVSTLWPGSAERHQKSVYLDLEALFKAQAKEIGITATVSHSADSIPGFAFPLNSTVPRNGERNLIVVKHG